MGLRSGGIQLLQLLSYVMVQEVIDIIDPCCFRGESQAHDYTSIIINIHPVRVISPRDLVFLHDEAYCIEHIEKGINFLFVGDLAHFPGDAILHDQVGHSGGITPVELIETPFPGGAPGQEEN